MLHTRRNPGNLAYRNSHWMLLFSATCERVHRQTQTYKKKLWEVSVDNISRRPIERILLMLILTWVNLIYCVKHNSVCVWKFTLIYWRVLTERFIFNSIIALINRLSYGSLIKEIGWNNHLWKFRCDWKNSGLSRDPGGPTAPGSITRRTYTLSVQPVIHNNKLWACLG